MRDEELTPTHADAGEAADWATRGRDQTAVVAIDGPGLDKGLMARLLLGATMLVLFVAFAIQNAPSVDVSFLVWDFKMRLFILMLLCAATGIVVWEIVQALDRRRKRKA